MEEKRVIYIEIFQPFAQYRNPFTFYYAQTYPLPPKSTIIGMLQNATGMWYGWGELEGEKITPEDWWNLKVSVYGGFESTFWNYQQLIKGEISFSSNGVLINRHDRNPLGNNVWLPLYSTNLKAQRSPIYQQELFNGHLFIFIKAESEKGIKLLNFIELSLKLPRKVLYLGRSEDIVFIKKVFDVSYLRKTESAERNLWFEYPTYLKENIKDIIDEQRYPVYAIPERVIFENKIDGKNKEQVKHKVEINQQTHRNVDFTTVIHIREDYILRLKRDFLVEYEQYTIDEKAFIIPEYGWL